MNEITKRERITIRGVSRLLGLAKYFEYDDDREVESMHIRLMREAAESSERHKRYIEKLITLINKWWDEGDYYYPEDDNDEN